MTIEEHRRHRRIPAAGRVGGIVAVCEGYLEWDTPEARAVITELMEE